MARRMVYPPGTVDDAKVLVDVVCCDEDEKAVRKNNRERRRSGTRTSTRPDPDFAERMNSLEVSNGYVGFCIQRQRRQQRPLLY